jgi:hypothetical protein
VVSVWESENTLVEIRYADHLAPSIRKKLTLTSPTSAGRLVGIFHSRTEATEFQLSGYKINAHYVNGNIFIAT